MAEYIDKWQAVANLFDARLKEEQKAIDAIQFMPAADVAEVTRCKDCVYFAEAEYGSDCVKKLCRLMNRQIQEYDYCSLAYTADRSRRKNDV